MNESERTLTKKINWTGHVSRWLTVMLLLVIAYGVALTYIKGKETAERVDQNFRCAIQVFTSGKRDITVVDYDKCVIESRSPQTIVSPTTVANGGSSDSNGSNSSSVPVQSFQPAQPMPAVKPSSSPNPTVPRIPIVTPVVERVAPVVRGLDETTNKLKCQILGDTLLQEGTCER